MQLNVSKIQKVNKIQDVLACKPSSTACITSPETTDSNWHDVHTRLG